MIAALRSALGFPSADQRFDRCVIIVLRHEGGFVDNKADPGGATNKGISLRYARTRGSLFDLDGNGIVDRSDILLITTEKAAIVYRAWFWRDVRGDELPAGVDLAMFDFAVNSGSSRAIKTMQKIIGTTPDGVFGPATLKALKRGNDRGDLVSTLCDERLKFLRSLSTYETFGRGWSRRVAEVRDAALVMI